MVMSWSAAGTEAVGVRRMSTAAARRFLRFMDLLGGLDSRHSSECLEV
jgi:hypothetical protein